MHNFRKLHIWTDSIDLATRVYKLTTKLPKEELYGLRSQINRCVVSIPSNIAEGAGRNTNKEFNHFLSIATGSSYELETQLMIAVNLGFFKEEEVETILSEIQSIQKRIYKYKQTLLK